MSAPTPLPLNPPTRRLRVFYSYSRKDKELRDKLDAHLSLLERQGLIEGWHDRDIEAGNDWLTEIDDNLERADLVLLLVSADFVASDYCYKLEMERALERHAEKTARVIPVILRQCDWKSAPFAKLNALPESGVAVKSWDDEDEALANVAAGIRQVVESIGGRHTPTVGRPSDDTRDKFDDEAEKHDPIPDHRSRLIIPDDRTQLISAIRAIVVLAIVVGLAVVIWKMISPDPVRVTLQPPIEARTIGKNLLITINFKVEGALPHHSVWVDVSADQGFDDAQLLRTMEVSPADKAGPRVTVTVQNHGDLMSGYVRLRVQDRNFRQVGDAVGHFTNGS